MAESTAPVSKSGQVGDVKDDYEEVREQVRENTRF